jgi:mxaL protein
MRRIHHSLKYWWQRLFITLRHAWHSGSLFFLMAALILTPVWFNPHTQQQSVVQDTLFVIDISDSMNVRDVDYPRPQSSRLDLAKLAVSEGMASLPCGSRVSLGLFAGEETIVLFEPLEVCRHFPAIEQVVARLDSRMRWIGDSWVVKSLSLSMKEAHNRKINLVMITDGDEMPTHSAPNLSELEEIRGKVKGLILGVGGETPQPIPHLNSDGEITGYWTPEEAVINGNYPNLIPYVLELKLGEKAPAGQLDEVTEHLSGYSKANLQSIAQAAAMELVHINKPRDAIQALNNSKFQKQALAERDARWIYGLAGAVLVLIGWFWQSLLNIFQRKRINLK